jgi:hypothetical protein
LQAKLEIGAVNSSLEREADAVADQVMRMTDPAAPTLRGDLAVSPKCAACEEEHKVLQPKTAGAPRPLSGEAPDLVHDVLNGSGSALDQSARRFMESRFARNFSDVSIHDDDRAASSADAIGARATNFTVRRPFTTSGVSSAGPSARALISRIPARHE